MAGGERNTPCFLGTGKALYGNPCFTDENMYRVCQKAKSARCVGLCLSLWDLKKAREKMSGRKPKYLSTERP